MRKLRETISNKWFKFGLVSLVYILWFVIWSENLWMLLGVPIIYDIYISKYMARLPFVKKHKQLKKENSSYRKTMEWIEAILFATIVASIVHTYVFRLSVIPSSSMEKSLLIGDYLIVSKIAYGPQMPNTPLSFPFVHHTMPLSQTKKSYSEAIKLPYKRLKGWRKMKHNDAVVFNFPAGDTVLLSNPMANYYDELRREEEITGSYTTAWNNLRRTSEIIVRPVDKRDHYVKRVAALPGDTIELRHSQAYINGEPQTDIQNLQYTYFVTTNGTTINLEALLKLGVSRVDQNYRNYGQSQIYEMPLTRENAEKLKAFSNVTEVRKYEDPRSSDPHIFPHSANYSWTVDNFGPLWIPKKGTSVTLNTTNLPLYHRIIETYEQNELVVRDSVIYINGQPATSYTFQMDYYFMMGDNRHLSSDSRFWGFVPEDHIVGRASVICLSKDPDYSFPKNIRWKRLFTKVR